MNKLYPISGVCGAIASVLSYILYTFSQGDAVNFKLLLGFLILGIIFGIFPIYKLIRRNLLENISKQAMIYLQINLFIGIIFGYLAGLLGSWLLVFPFGLIFGHPDGGWPPFVGYLFFFLAGILFVISLLFFPVWFAGKLKPSGSK